MTIATTPLHLGRNSDLPASPDAAVLDYVPNPRPERTYLVRFAAPEFTSLCPMTGSPDFATIVIDYRPAALCVESKSLKLYMMAYRNTGEFHEACVTRILNDLVQVLKPVYMRVTGRFTPRGGIPFHPTVSYHSDDSVTDPLPGLFDAEVPGA